jgi:hypothetical protein
MILFDVPESPTVELVVEAGPNQQFHSLPKFSLPFEFWFRDNMVMYSYNRQPVLTFHLIHQLPDDPCPRDGRIGLTPPYESVRIWSRAVARDTPKSKFFVQEVAPLPA